MFLGSFMIIGVFPTVLVMGQYVYIYFFGTEIAFRFVGIIIWNITVQKKTKLPIYQIRF